MEGGVSEYIFLNPEVCVSDAREMLIPMCSDTWIHVHVIRVAGHSMVPINLTLFRLLVVNFLGLYPKER